MSECNFLTPQMRAGYIIQKLRSDPRKIYNLGLKNLILSYISITKRPEEYMEYARLFLEITYPDFQTKELLALFWGIPSNNSVVAAREELKQFLETENEVYVKIRNSN